MSRVLKGKKNQITYKYKKNVHNGIDLVGYKNRTCYIIAHSDGRVEYVRKNYKTKDKTGNSYGNYVKIKHNKTYSSLYAHLKYGKVLVKKGQKVKKGDLIGYMGTTGRSTGNHLHFEIFKNGKKINPTNYINKDIK